jgi:HTH-type transcriptional regulator, competence development regulator
MKKKREKNLFLRKKQITTLGSIGKKTSLDQDGTDTLTFGSMLRVIRQEKGVGLRKLAARVGISAPYLSNIETDKFPPPSDEKLRLIARELDEDPDKLLAKAGDRMIVDPLVGTGSLPRSAFGEVLRELREQKGIGLRQLAAKIGISPSYLSNVETAKFPPPSEATLCAIAHDLGHNSDELLAMAGKTASDLSVIIRKYPRQFAAILRSLRGFEESDFLVLINGLAKQFSADFVDGGLPQPKKEDRKEEPHSHLPIDWKLLGETFGGDSQAGRERNEWDGARIPLRRNKSKEAVFWGRARDRLRSVEASIDKEMVAGKRALENKGKKSGQKPADAVLART